LSAYRNIGKFDGKNPKGWLCAIAANKCRDFLKKTAAKKCVSLSEGFPGRLEHYMGSPEDIVLEKEMEERLYGMCSKLREPYKTVAINYFCDNLKLSEVAANTGQKLKTLQMRLYRAKQILRKLWEEEFDEQSC
jgi:RNA polymerase sigma-70 factor (ECF subfamily)